MENKVLALVNGTEITQRDLENTVARFPRERQTYFASEEGKKQLLEQMISFELIYNYAKENNVQNDEKYVRQLESFKKELLTQTAIDNVLSQVKVTNEEIAEYYLQNKNMFLTEESVTAKHILVDSIEKANEVISQINGGMLFEEAAQTYSSCPSKAQGGNLGAFTRGRMVPEFEKVAFELEIGVISEPVKTQFGYHLIKVEEKQPSSIKPIEQVGEIIYGTLIQEKQNKIYMDFTNKLRENSSIEIK